MPRLTTVAQIQRNMSFDDYLLQNFNLKSCTTFWSDFGIADHFGKDAVIDTFKRSKYWISDVKMWTELTIVLNLRCWQHYDKGLFELSQVYADLYHKADTMAYEHFKDEDKDYYFQYTD